MHPHDTFKINMGRLTHEQAATIARELRRFWQYTENIYPQGDKKRRPQLKVTRDKFGQYQFYLNSSAISHVLIHLKDIPEPVLGKQATHRQHQSQDHPGDLPECPPEVPDFLRWDGRSSSGSTPE